MDTLEVELKIDGVKIACRRSSVWGILLTLSSGDLLMKPVFGPGLRPYIFVVDMSWIRATEGSMETLKGIIKYSKLNYLASLTSKARNR